jgi:hypothetical protein
VYTFNRHHMRRLFILTVSLSLTVLAFGQRPASPQSPPEKKEAVGLLEKANESTWVTVPGRAPFHLAAKVHNTVGANCSDGTYGCQNLLLQCPVHDSAPSL